jgi:gamma-glutamyltranspeptidase/glutathione hydrolase
MKLALRDAEAYVADARPHDAPSRSTTLLMRPPTCRPRRQDRPAPRRHATFGAGAPRHGGTVYLTAADAGHDGVVHPVELCRLRLGRLRARHRHLRCRTAAPASAVDPAHPNFVGPAQAAVPHHHSGLPDEARTSPLMSLGVMGGPMQAQGHVQMVCAPSCSGQDPQMAADAPRWRVTDGLGVACETTAARRKPWRRWRRWAT